MTPAERWLRREATGAPPALVAAMVRAIPPGDQSVADALAQAALGLYAQVAHGAGGREDALPLLAADALFTHAFHAQAEIDPSELPALIARYGASGHLATLATS